MGRNSGTVQINPTRLNSSEKSFSAYVRNGISKRVTPIYNEFKKQMGDMNKYSTEFLQKWVKSFNGEKGKDVINNFINGRIKDERSGNYKKGSSIDKNGALLESIMDSSAIIIARERFVPFVIKEINRRVNK